MKNYFNLFKFCTNIVIGLALFGISTSNTMAQEVRSEYVPFVEEGKAWYCTHTMIGRITPEHPEGENIDCIFTMRGDTLIIGREYKKVYCQYGDYYGDEEQHYYCAVREEAYQVFIVERELTEEKLIYDFSHSGEIITLTYDDYTFARTDGWHRYDSLPGQLEYLVGRYSDGEVDYSNDPTFWFDGVGAVYYNPFSFDLPLLRGKPTLGENIVLRTCMMGDKYIFDIDWMYDVYHEKCATPTIAYDKGRLVFSCETPDVEYVYEIKCSDNGSGRGDEVSLSQTYEIRVRATLDGYDDSDVAVATIGWRNGRPVMEGFSSVTLDTDERRGDVNGDGIVDVADIATVISVIAAQKSE